VFHYNAAISACEKARNWKRALSLLEEAQQKGINPTAITYNAAISACAKGKQWEMALSLLEEVQHKGIHPDIITYNAAISACAKGGQREKALELFGEVQKLKGIEPNVVTYALSKPQRTSPQSRGIC
jgi:pentatricopeptide repeat domain-containing protein 1